MPRSNSLLLLVAAGVFLLPAGAAAKVALTLTPAEAPIRIAETGDFTAVVTGNVAKTVKLQVCDGFGQNCVTGGSTTLGTIAQIGTDSNNNPIARYIAPATLPPNLFCQLVVLGCQVKIQGILKFTKRGRTRKKKSTATVVLAAPGVIRRASVASDGTEANGESRGGRISADGRFVAFHSFASNLVPGDTTVGFLDAFGHDIQTGQTIRVSVASDGTEANGPSGQISVSAGGRFFAFQTGATNLVSPDANGGVEDVLVHDRETGQTTRISVSTDGVQGNLGSHGASKGMTSDGRFVAFFSNASNLVTGDTNSIWDAFVHDRQSGQTTRVSVASDGTEGNNSSGTLSPSISADGRFVAFDSSATNLVSGDTNGVLDIFLHDRQTGQTSRVSVDTNGIQANAKSEDYWLSANGRFVAFRSDATNLVPDDTSGVVDVFVRDTCAGASGCTPSTTRVSVANDGTQANNLSDGPPSISADGRFVAFESEASNLVPGDTNGFRDIFVRDTCVGASGPCTPTTVRVSVAVDGTEANAASFTASLSPDGRFVAFTTTASNLSSGDTNNADDIVVARTSFVRPPLAYVGHGADPAGKLAIIDTGTNTKIASVDVGGTDTAFFSISPDGLRAYVSDTVVSGSVFVLNTLSNTVIANIPMGDRPLFPAVTPDGTRLYVANCDSNNISVVDTGTNTVTTTIPVGLCPGGVIFKADGTRGYVGNEGSDTVSVIDTSSNTVVDTIAVGDGPEGSALSPDESRLYVVNFFAGTVSVVNTSTKAVVATIPVGSGPHMLVLTPDGTRAYVPNEASNNVSVINTATNSVIATIPVAANPEIAVIVPEGPTLYVTHNSVAVGAVTVIDVASNTVKTTIPIGGSGAGIALRFVR